MRWFVLVLACCGHPAATVDAMPDAALIWQSVTVTMQDASIVVEQVTYLGTDGLVL